MGNLVFRQVRYACAWTAPQLRDKLALDGLPYTPRQLKRFEYEATPTPVPVQQWLRLRLLQAGTERAQAHALAQFHFHALIRAGQYAQAVWRYPRLAVAYQAGDEAGLEPVTKAELTLALMASLSTPSTLSAETP